MVRNKAEIGTRHQQLQQEPAVTESGAAGTVGTTGTVGAAGTVGTAGTVGAAGTDGVEDEEDDVVAEFLTAASILVASSAHPLPAVRSQE